MTTATQPPELGIAHYDDPDLPGRYMTDGNQLFRLLGPAAVRSNYLEIEDCATLDVWLVDARELSSRGMTSVCSREIAVAA